MTSPAPSYSSLLSQHTPVPGHVGIKVGMKVGIRVCPAISSQNVITGLQSQIQYLMIMCMQCTKKDNSGSIDHQITSKKMSSNLGKSIEKSSLFKSENQINLVIRSDMNISHLFKIDTIIF